MKRVLVMVPVAIIFFSSCAHDISRSDPGDFVSQDIRIELIDQAKWAMSAHNVQPWDIVLDDSDSLKLAVHLPTSRLLPETDPYSRQLMLSVGGFLSLLEDFAAVRGYQTEVELFPDGKLPVNDIGADFKSPLAVVVFEEVPFTSAPEYLDAIASATPKADLQPVILKPSLERSLLALNRSVEIDLRFIHDPPVLARIKPILKDSFRLEMTHAPTLDESYDLTRRNNRQIETDSWGLSYRSSFRGGSLGFIQLFETLFPMKRETWGETGADNYDVEIDRAASFITITTDGNTRRHQIEAGKVFERVWRKLIHEGYAVLPASQPIQEYSAMAELYNLIHESLADTGETIQMVAAIGIPPEGFREGFRLPTADLIKNASR